MSLGTDLVFSNFFKLYFHLKLITTPHVIYVHMTYVYSFPYVSFFTQSHGQEKSLLYYDLFRLWSITVLWTHPHLCFLLLPLQPPHPYTHHPDPQSTAQSVTRYVMAMMYGESEDPGNTVEDCVQPKPGPAKVRLVLPSNPSVLQAVPCYREPSLD